MNDQNVEKIWWAHKSLDPLIKSYRSAIFDPSIKSNISGISRWNADEMGVSSRCNIIAQISLSFLRTSHPGRALPAHFSHMEERVDGTEKGSRFPARAPEPI
jgi:hypothetical protein